MEGICKLLTLADSTVQQDAPSKPDGTGQVKSVFLCTVRVGKPVSAEGWEAIEEVEYQRDNMHRDHN